MAPKSKTQGSSKGSDIEDTASNPSSSSSMFVPKQTNFLIDLEPSNYHPSIQVVIEFIAKAFLKPPLTVVPKNLPQRLVDLAFQHFVLKDDGEVEIQLENSQVGTVTQEIFLEAIGVAANPDKFVHKPPTEDQIHEFLLAIGYTGSLVPKDFKKSQVPALWATFMHLMMKGISGKTGGSDQISRDWLHLPYSIFKNEPSAVDFPKILWSDFTKYNGGRKPRDIPCPRF